MPKHLLDHLATNMHCPGVLTFREPLEIPKIVGYLALASIACVPADFLDQIHYPDLS